MRLQCEESVTDTVWDDLVRSCGGSVFHSSAWAQYICQARAHTTPIYCRLSNDDGLVAGIALGFRTCSRKPLLRRCTGHLWFDSLPAVRAGCESLNVLVGKIEAYARAQRDVELSFGSYAYRGGSDVLRDRGYSLSNRIEFELDLAASVETMWMSLQHKRRKNVQKSRRAGVVVEGLDAEEGLRELFRLMDITWERLEQRGVRRTGGARNGGRDVPERSLLDCGVAKLVGARLGNEWLSVSLFTQFGGQAYHLLSGHSPQGLAVQAPTLLLWETICSLKAEGVHRFNFGGCAASASDPDSVEHGVFDYKRAFGGEQLACSSGRILLRPVRVALVRALKKLTCH